MDKKTAIYVTKEGYAQYLATLDDYKAQYAKLLKTRVDYGKNSVENYQTGVYDMEAEAILSNIRNLTATIANMSILTEENAEENTVNIGDIVTVQIIGDDDVRKVQIVGGAPDLGRDDGVVSITVNSPMGGAIYKKKIGDVASYRVRNNEFSVMIVSKEKTIEKEAQGKQPLSES